MLESVDNGVLTLRSNHCSRDHLSRLSRLRDGGFFSDVTLIVEGKEIRAHRLVLAACSSYFESMLTAGFKVCNFFIFLIGLIQQVLLTKR